MYGLLCIDDLHIVGHSLFNNFRLALYNYFGKDIFKDVKSTDDLTGITHLFIVDEHHIPCVEIWKHDCFINTLNEQKIKAMVFNFEKIFSSSFPWNVDHQRKLETINNLTQFVSDIDDARTLNKNIINKQFLSRDTDLGVVPLENKNDRILFLGQVNSYYPTRQQVLQDAQASGLPVDIIVTDRKLTYTEFLEKLNAYTFILNPLGTGAFLNIRFYEALKLGCTLIQQITPDMSNWYPELNRALVFTEFNQINKNSLTLPKNTSDYYLEDYFSEIDLNQYL
ncbi:hypothetical protein UFOVP760_215 [uncultured Caudovirales phage]|uniref:Uncharacterized protein n=1 Tax=uncultured Caudovirales phage TaxID=2100421 RepID=A0A6J7X773_9CAUD|nr:hypothetical protein UFOVP760_215 [uncultured Caudovirales phage]